MAFSANFGIWIVQGNGKESKQVPFKIFVNPNDTIYKIKQKVAEKTNTKEKGFCLFKSGRSAKLDDDVTIKDYSIRSGDKLIKEDKKPYKRRGNVTGLSASVPPSPYVRSDNGISLPYVENRRHQMRKSKYDKKDPLKGSTHDISQRKKPPQDKSIPVLLEDIAESQGTKKSSQAQTELPPIKKEIPEVTDSSLIQEHTKQLVHALSISKPAREMLAIGLFSARVLSDMEKLEIMNDSSSALRSADKLVEYIIHRIDKHEYCDKIWKELDNVKALTDVVNEMKSTRDIDIDHGEVLLACKPVSSKWRYLGARLAVSENTLATIQTDYTMKDVERCMSAVIDKWLRRPVGEVVDDGVLPTWRNLCVALSPIDRVLAEGIAVEHGCGYISLAVDEVYSKNHVPPAFLPQSCGCGQCTIQGWMTGRQCQNMIKCDWGPKLLVVNSSNKEVDKELVKFGNIVDRQTNLCIDTSKIIQHFTSVSVTTWEHLAMEMIDERKFSIMVVKFAAWLRHPFTMLSNIHDLQNLLHSLHVSWLNFGALHFLATQFLSTYSDVMAIWSDYCIHFKDYCCKRNLKGFVNVFFKIEEQNVFVIEIDECYYKLTLADIKSFRKSLSIVLDVSAVSLHLVTVRGGSVIIYFYYCYSDYLTRFKLSSQQLKKIAHIKPHKILSLTDLYNQFEYDHIQSYYYYEDSSSSTSTELQLWKKQANVKDIELSKKEAEIRLLKDQFKKNKDQLELEIKEAKAEMMELKDTISKKEDIELSKKQAEIGLLKDQFEKNKDQLELEIKKAKAEMMELKDTISKKEAITQQLMTQLTGLITDKKWIQDKQPRDIEILSRRSSRIRNVRVVSGMSFKKCRGECLMSPDDIPNFLYQTAVNCQHMWYMMGSLLGLSIEELAQISEIHSNSSASCYADMISRYVSSNQLRPTWRLITKYLMQPLEQHDLGMQLRKEYCKDCCYIEVELNL